MLVGFADRRHAVALEPEDLSDLGGGRNFQSQRFPGQRLNLRLAAEYRRRQRHRHVCVEIPALALESRVRRHLDPQVEITGWRAADTMLAFAADSHTRSFADPGRNP